MERQWNDDTHRFEWRITKAGNKVVYVWGWISIVFTAISFVAAFIEGWIYG